MTKREAFAMAAMQGLLTREGCYTQRWKDVADDAVKYADALIAALEKPREVTP